MQYRRKDGFSLIEIAIVVTIIGLLAAMAIAGFRQARRASQDTAVLNNLRQIATAAQQYMLENGSTSVTVADLYPTFLREPENVAQETYPTSISLTASQIEATGVGGTRTVTYIF